MKKILLSISLLALAYTASANVPVIKSDPKIEAQVEQTLKKLTLEEKIGQMMELVTDLFGANDKMVCSISTSTRPILSFPAIRLALSSTLQIPAHQPLSSGRSTSRRFRRSR